VVRGRSCRGPQVPGRGSAASSRREIIRFIGSGTKSREEIERQFGLQESVAEVHLSLLEKAGVIEKTEEGYRLTPIGDACLKSFR